MPDITEPIPASLGFGSASDASPLFSHGSIAKLWVDGFPVAADLSEVSMSYDLSLIETTPFGHTDTTFMPGKDSSSFDMEGFYTNNTSDPDSTFEKYLFDRKRSLLPVTYLPGFSTSVGDPAYFLNGRHVSHSIETEMDDAAKFEIELQGSSVLSRGVILKVDGNHTVNGTTSSYDTGASHLGIRTMLNVAATTGVLPTLDVTIQHSSDNSTWSNLVTFDQATEMSAEYISDSTSVVQRYLRVSWTIAGAGASFTFNVVAAQNGVFV